MVSNYRTLEAGTMLEMHRPRDCNDRKDKCIVIHGSGASKRLTVALALFIKPRASEPHFDFDE